MQLASLLCDAVFTEALIATLPSVVYCCVATSMLQLSMAQRNIAFLPVA
jgi:hypothetical protein